MDLLYSNNATLHTFLTAIGIGGSMLLIFFYLFSRRFNEKRQRVLNSGEDVVNAFQFCDTPSCIRCNKNTIVNQTALEKFHSVEREGCERIEKAIKTSDTAVEFDEPPRTHILYIPGLTSRSVWELEDLPESYRSDCDILKKNIDIFKKDYFNHNKPLKSSNGWSKVFLVNQGTETADIQHYHTTMNIMNTLNNIMRGCMFGYIFFSVLHEGSTITEHCGPTNCRLRCHVSLQVPVEDAGGGCCMDVDGTVVRWKENGVVFFDDSLKHSVNYPCPSTTTTTNDRKDDKGLMDRIVLLVDFWHPDLSLAERRCIRQCYSPS